MISSICATRWRSPSGRWGGLRPIRPSAASSCSGRARRGARLDAGGRAAACGDDGAGAGGRGGARRDGLCDAGALRASGTDAALRERADPAGIARVVVAVEDPDPRVSGKGIAMLLGRRHRGRDRRAGARGGACSMQGFFLRVKRGAPAGDAQDRAEPRRQDRDRLGREQMDHRARRRGAIGHLLRAQTRRDPGRRRARRWPTIPN